MNMITWFEIPVIGFARAKAFYETVLGCPIHEQRSGAALYGHFGDSASGVAGALVKHEWYIPGDRGVLVYLDAGDDLTPMLARVEAAGGRVLSEKTLISSEIGYFAVFLDTEGNRLALHSRH
jgi:predicted enzyme related to lactoylglutathione lyase